MKGRGQLMTSNLFVNADRQLRSGWWILIFLLVFASLLLPMLIAAQVTMVPHDQSDSQIPDH
jgi:hypothetical protein